LEKIGVLRGPCLNPFEGQYFEKLPKFGFQPVGIATFDISFDRSEIGFPVRYGHTFKTVTRGKFNFFLNILTITKFDFRAYNFYLWDFKKLTSDLPLLHSNDISYAFSYQAVKTKIPTIITEWENIPFNYETQPYSKIKSYCRTHAQHFVAITQKAKEALLMEGVNDERISVIPAGIDCERFKPSQKDPTLLKQKGIPPNSFNVLFVGRLVPEKGIFSLLEAFSNLQNKFSNIQLLIVGSGSPEIKAQINKFVIDKRIGKNVKFLGAIRYRDMPKIHNIADVFCLPSIPVRTWAEQFGFSLVEAMACGKPVVSTFSGSIPEVVRDRQTGYLVEPNNARSIEVALESLIVDEKTRTDLGKNGRQWVLQQFEANVVAKQLADIYKRQLGNMGTEN